MTSISRKVHFYGDSHMQGFEIDHDEILGRNTYQEKKDLDLIHYTLITFNITG